VLPKYSIDLKVVIVIVHNNTCNVILSKYIKLC